MNIQIDKYKSNERGKGEKEHRKRNGDGNRRAWDLGFWLILEEESDISSEFSFAELSKDPWGFWAAIQICLA